MTMVKRTFKTKEELWACISTETLPGANVSGLTVEYNEIDGTEENTEGCVGCNINHAAVEAAETTISPLDEARAAYTEKTGRLVPNNKKNDIDWLTVKAEEEK